MPLESFIKAGITFSVKDDILIKGSGNDLPYIAKLLAIDSKSKIEGEDGYTLRVNWYYRPEDIARKSFHGKQELFVSDHIDTIHSATILSKCHVWTLDEYRDLAALTSLDFFTRYNYSTSKKRFTPEFVPVYCSCEQPDNPDQFMAECDKCMRWYHPECEGSSSTEVQNTRHFLCRACFKESAGARAPPGMVPLPMTNQMTNPMGAALGVNPTRPFKQLNHNH